MHKLPLHLLLQQMPFPWAVFLSIAQAAVLIPPIARHDMFGVPAISPITRYFIYEPQVLALQKQKLGAKQ